MNFNYTNICHYCGIIYQSNRSSSKYCSPNHNALFHQHGSRVDYTFENYDGVLSNCKDILAELSSGIETEGGWGPGYSVEEIYVEKHYSGPIPLGQEILFVSGHLIKKKNDLKLPAAYFFKPFELLTLEEKANGLIQAGCFGPLKELEMRCGEMSKVYSELYDVQCYRSPFASPDVHL
jgi:hypothetical protein